jgi:hypothetical protein
VVNDPLQYTDPTGHMQCEDYQGACLSENQVSKIHKANAYKKKDKAKPQQNVKFVGLSPWSVDEMLIVYQAWGLLESDFGGSDNLASALGGAVYFVHVPPGSLGGNVAEANEWLNVIWVDQNVLNSVDHKEWYVLHEVAHIFDMTGSNGNPGLYKSNTFVDAFISGGCSLTWHGCTGPQWNPTDRDTTAYGRSGGSVEDFADSFASTVLYNHNLESSSYRNVSQSRMNIINIWISMYASPK